MATTAILIVNWNGRKFLEECFAALRAQTLAPDRILLVDNGSTDGSVDWMKENAPTVEVLALGRNTGFAEGNNIGLRKLFENPPTYVALLNNDTRAEPQWLEALVSELEKDASLGSAASCMVYHSKPEEVNNAGDQPLWDGAGIARGRHRPDEEFAIPAEVFGPCGGAALYRLEALRQCALGDDYFDSGYFAYNEDVDLSWRLRRRGWKCLYVAGARVLHHHGGSSGRFSPFVLYHGERNRCWTLLK
ncbi:MAG: glycosyltransferase family 2 protein, partial [Verrucomicrobiae bacterium]|nr:glycosyltransferase family 2 protein [Verrucomicrobiae bacterium]